MNRTFVLVIALAAVIATPIIAVALWIHGLGANTNPMVPVNTPACHESMFVADGLTYVHRCGNVISAIQSPRGWLTYSTDAMGLWEGFGAALLIVAAAVAIVVLLRKITTRRPAQLA